MQLATFRGVGSEMEGGCKESDTTSQENALLDSGMGGLKSIVLVTTATVHIAAELDEMLLQFALVELRGGAVSNDRAAFENDRL